MTNGQNRRYALCFALLTAGLLVLAALNLTTGSSRLSVSEVLAALGPGQSGSAAAGVVRQIRLPRLAAAALLGGALSVSGFLLQSFFANPIAGPFVLGVSSGAKLMVALCMIFCLSRGLAISSAGMIAAAFCGALLAMGFVLLASARLRGMGMLIVCGVMVGYICSAVTEIAVAFADDANIVNLRAWSLGSFSGVSWDSLRIIAPLAGGGLAWSFLLAKPMSAYQLGEGYAQNLGVELRTFRAELILLSSLLSACVTAFAGPISFVGVAVPHLMRSLLKTAKPILMVPACFLGGAAFCLGCDLVARTLFAPTELAIGSVTAVFGAPVVIWMLLKRQRRDGL